MEILLKSVANLMSNHSLSTLTPEIFRNIAILWFKADLSKTIDKEEVILKIELVLKMLKEECCANDLLMSMLLSWIMFIQKTKINRRFVIIIKVFIN